MERTNREMTFEEEAKFYEEEARAEFAKETGNGDCGGVNNILRRGMRIIRKARQEIASREVVHGRWKKNWHDNNLIGHEYEECSVCGSCIISDTEKFWDCNYCPNCGAKMGGGNEDA